MENSPSARRGWGPRPGRERPLSPSRAAILAQLLDQPEALTLPALVSCTGLHENTVREHLDGLLRRGLVTRQRSEPSGRGRPAWRYQAVGSQGGVPEYAGLAAALAASIAGSADNPTATAVEAGEAWGRDLARERGATPTTPQGARREVVRLLDDLGFEPETGDDDESVVRLTRCPLLQAAHRHPEIVCSVHLGIVNAVLEAHGADPSGSELEPFAEPGACRLVVPPRDPVGV